MQVPERVTICEVGTRDGFQIEPDFIPTEQKVEVVNRLSEAGVPRIEVTSFVHPRAIPQLRDAEAVMAAIRRRPGTRYAALVPEFPFSYRRIIEGDEVRVGKHAWRAIIGHGHAPEHLSLFSPEANTLIAGDMLLSTISTNVSVWSIDPEGDPLRLFLDSVAGYRKLPEDVLVLPSHGKPFRGAHRRVAALEQHHQDRLQELTESLRSGPKSACELLQVLFRRPLDAHQTFFAMGEAIAHLHYLYYAGRARRRVDPDGIMRYATR